jgi:predicted NUDIX family NTP pyrophosphohydrolase
VVVPVNRDRPLGATPQSAGLLLYRRTPHGIEVLLGHMGGPYFARRDAGGWSIPKGGCEGDELLLAAARREFEEEFGTPAPTDGVAVELGTVRQRSGKFVTAWAIEADFDASAIVSNTFEVEWPPKSGQRQSFPEIDRAAWFDVETARAKMVAGQDVLLDRLLDQVQLN